MKPKKAGKILKAQDKRFAALGGATLSGWLESPDRVALVLAASPGAARAAKGRHDQYTTGVNSRLLAKDVGRELRGQRRGPSPDERFDSYLLRKASAGDRGAAELLEKRGGPGADPEYLAWLDDLAKSRPTTPDGRRAQDLLDEKAREALERRGQRGSR